MIQKAKLHVAALCAVLLAHACASSPRGPALAITHVTIVDGRDSVPRRDQTVIVRGNRIDEVGDAASMRVPRGATVLDGRGRFLIPGLWDMHVHTDVPAGREVLALFVEYGVTSVRDMAGEWRQLQRWNDSIAAGQLVGPRIVASGPYLEGGPTPIPHLLVRDTLEAVAAVDSLVRLDVPFIKVHSRLTPDVYFAVARRARHHRIPFVGHVSNAVGAQAASDSGQRSIEHSQGIPVPCTPAESLALAPRFQAQVATGRCSSRDLTPLYQTLVRNGTWITPTLVALYLIAQWPNRDVPGDTVAHLIPDTLRRFVEQILPVPGDVRPGADSVGNAVFEKRLAQIGAMHRAGVGIFPGTDAPLRNSPPGVGLHEELRLLSLTGIPPWALLRAATLEPARFLNMADSLGLIAPGQLADLVLLAANPLEDIRNTGRIQAVIANGRVRVLRRRS